eukprot:jgi/Picre1/35941/NNA_003398.t1
MVASHGTTPALPGKTGERRRLSTGNEDEIDDVRYHKEADHTLEYLVEAFENLLDDIDADDADVELSQGVLNLNLGSIGTYVINKQTPNKQIWVSSPVSGPVRYDFVKGFWTYKRDGHLFHQRLEEEIKALTGVDIDLNPCSKRGCGWMRSQFEPLRLRVLRSSQSDAAQLDEELLGLFKDYLNACLGTFHSAFMSSNYAEILLALKTIIFGLTVAQGQPTPGMSLLNLRYRDERSASSGKVRAISTGQRTLLYVGSILLPYVWGRVSSRMVLEKYAANRKSMDASGGPEFCHLSEAWHIQTITGTLCGGSGGIQPRRRVTADKL